MLIGIHGKARSGKDTCADYLVENHRFKRYSFADPLKQGAQVMLDWGYEDVYGVRKDEVDPMYGFSPRYVLQTLGTDWGRVMLRDDIWIKVAESKVAQIERCVIPDIRFDNEANFIRENGGIVIHLTRQDAPQVEAHASEEGIYMNIEDYVINNDGTLTELYESLEGILQNL